MLELDQLAGRLLDEYVDRVLVREPVGTAHRVAEMVLEGVVVLDRAGGAAFGRHRVAAHRVDLRHDGQIKIRKRFRGRDRGTQTSTAAADD